MQPVPGLLRPVVRGLPAGDVALAAALAAASLVQVLVAPVASLPVSLLVVLGSTLPLCWRHRAPSAAALAGSAVWLVPTPQGFLLLGFVMAALLFYAVGAHEPSGRRQAAVAATGTALGVTATLLGPEPWQACFGIALAVLAPVVAGRLVARSRAQTRELERLTADLLRERGRAERAAAAEERARIARELHDVLGHEVTVIALQADAAAAALRSAPERAAAPVAAIRRSATQALDEMRRVLGALRVTDPGPDAPDEPLHPQPGLEDLPALVERARGVGGAVALSLEAPPGPVPPSVGLAVYRLVQEALTNARRHAPGAAVAVEVRAVDRAVVVRVQDDGARTALVPAQAGAGLGLVGMRERVRVLGGRWSAGPLPGGGFCVEARLPLDLPVQA